MTNAETDRFIVSAEISSLRTSIKSYRKGLEMPQFAEQHAFLREVIADCEKRIVYIREYMRSMW